MLLFYYHKFWGNDMSLNEKRGDFHIHSIYSDGTHTPKEILEYVKSSKLDYFSITDHDNVTANEEILKINSNTDIKFIPGVELSTFNKGESIHILGYFKDKSYKNRNFLEKLEDVRNSRENRAREIIFRLKHYFNIIVDFEKLQRISKGVIARPHIAQCIVEAGYPYTYDSVFKTVLSKSSPAYVDTKAISTEEGVKLLKNHNALTFLAHPVLYKKNSLLDLLSFGFNGFEAIYPLNKEGITSKYKNIARKKNMLISAGTDFHSLTRDSMHPANIGDVYLTGTDLDKFLAAFKVIALS